MQTSFTLKSPATLRLGNQKPPAHLALAFAAKFWCLFCRMEIILEPARQKF